MATKPPADLPELPRLTDMASAMAAQEQVILEVRRGLIAWSIGSVLNRGLQNWREMHSDDMDRHIIKALEAKVHQQAKLIERLQTEGRRIA